VTATLPLALGLVVAFGVLVYAIMDGFDLGIGALFLFAADESDRDAMMNAVAPFWDGNETWLVLGGTLLIAAFPVAYASLLPAFYLPLMVMLFGLIFRGIAFEFRFRAARFRKLWDWAFALGSLVAGFCQGVVLGAYIDGIAVHNGQFAGGPFDFLTAFSVACGAGVVAGYALLGATWLILKTEGATRAFGRRAARVTLLLTLAFIALVSLWTPLTHPRIAARWFSWPNIGYLSPVPIATALIALGLWRAAARSGGVRPFLLAAALVLLAFLGLGISLWPYAVPYAATLEEAASSPPTLAFVAVGVAVILPLNLLYLGYAHWVFRGRAEKTYGS
jgi:cytochrome d ubiquinol oxidase subunit II